MCRWRPLVSPALGTGARAAPLAVKLINFSAHFRAAQTVTFDSVFLCVTSIPFSVSFVPSSHQIQAMSLLETATYVKPILHRCTTRSTTGDHRSMSRLVRCCEMLFSSDRITAPRQFPALSKFHYINLVGDQVFDKLGAQKSLSIVETCFRLVGYRPGWRSSSKQFLS